MCFSEGLTYIFASEKLRRRGISRFCILIVESVCNATRGVTGKLSNFLFVFIVSPGDELKDVRRDSISHSIISS